MEPSDTVDDKTRIKPRASALDETRVTQPSDTSAVTKVVKPRNPRTAAQNDTLQTPTSRIPEGTFPTFGLTAPASMLCQDDLVPGAIIKQRFVLEKRIGRGGMGTIFLAKDLRKEELKDRDPYTVIKFLNEELHDSMDAIMALQREAKKSQQLSHPNVVTVYDFDRENTIFFLSMEYLRGESLDTYIARSANKAEKPAQIMKYVEYMARGLAYAHQEGFVHADFKPANVFLTEDNHVKILDFGIAQAVRSNIQTHIDNQTVFDPNSMGALTPNYASYEMLKQHRPIQGDDVYALACVAYELLTGVHPYRNAEGKRMNAVDAFDQGLEPEPITNISKRHWRAIKKGLSFKREDRFADAGEFIDAIKPRTKLRNSVIALIAGLSVTAVVSWGIAVNQTEAVIGFDDLPENMSGIVQTIKQGDDILLDGDIDQAHKLYAQAWEASFDVVMADSRNQYKLKVILDRRFNKIIDRLLGQAKQKDIDEFSLMQLQVALEFLKKDDLGSRDAEIEAALKQLDARLEAMQ